MKVACYIRVSTVGQNEESQKNAIQTYCENHNFEPVFYIDKASGTNMNRPAFEKMQQDLFEGSVKTVLVYKLDRLSRNISDGLQVLSSWLEKEIRIISISQQFDFKGAIGKMIASVLLGVAEMENETRKERQALGIELAKTKGVYKGRKSGATKSKPTQAIKLRDEGKKLSEIAKIMDVSLSTIQRYLKSTA
jgi:DNA invertase Pin-like site-specific DNA recombinase